jgi:thiaminase
MKAEQPTVIESVMTEVIEPGIQRLLESNYFAELRSGKLSKRRIQAWALQHYLYNITIAKGQVICMFKYAHDAELYGAFAEKFTEEQHHPNLVKRFGAAMGLKTKTLKRRDRHLKIYCT